MRVGDGRPMAIFLVRVVLVRWSVLVRHQSFMLVSRLFSGLEFVFLDASKKFVLILLPGLKINFRLKTIRPMVEVSSDDSGEL